MPDTTGFGRSMRILVRPMVGCVWGLAIRVTKDRVAGYVLSDFAKADQIWLDDLLRGISDGAVALAAGDGARFLNAVALRVNPPRASSGTQTGRAHGGGKGAAAAAEAATGKAPPSSPRIDPPEAVAPDSRSAMEKLMDRFRR